MTNGQQPFSTATEHNYSLQYPQLDETPNTISTEASTSLEMDIDSQSDDGQNSLSDSTYEIISQSSFHTSDDEELHEDGTDSMVSFGAHTPEEGSSVDGDEYIPPQQLEPTPITAPSFDRGQLNTHEKPSPPSLETSVNLSTVSTTTITDSHNDWIRFKEPSTSFASGLFDVTPHAQRRFNQFSGSRTTVSIGKTLATHIMRLNGPYRILFCATSSEAYLKESILEKIGQALHVSVVPTKLQREPSKETLNVVPISSFGNEGSTPEVMLVPSAGLQFDVDDCSGSDTISPAQSDRGDGWHYHRPDLAVFVHRNLSSDCESLTSDFLRSEVLKRQGIPVIDICGDLPDHTFPAKAAIRNPATLAHLGFKSSKGRAVHMICETTGKIETEHLKFSLPIDHQTFQQMDSLELNRNITALAGEASILNFGDAQWFILSLAKAVWFRMFLLYTFLNQIRRHYTTPLFAIARSAYMNAVVPRSKQMRTYVAGFRKEALTGMALGLLCCSSLWIYQFGSSSTLVHPRLAAKTPIITNVEPIGRAAWPTTRPTLPAPAVPLLLSGSPPPPKTRALTAIQIETSLSTIPAVRKACTKTTPKIYPEFKLVEAKDGRLFLHSNKPIPRKWKPSATFVSAVQHGKSCGISVSKIEGTVFELHLDSKDFCAPIVVTIRPHEGQAASQSFQLSQQCPDLPLLDALAKAYTDARSRLVLAESGLRELLNSHRFDLSSVRMTQINTSYTAWAPHIALWAQESLLPMKRLSEEAKKARLALNAAGDEHLDKVARIFNENVEKIRKKGLQNMHWTMTALSHKYEVVHQRARQLHLLKLRKVLDKKRFPPVAPDPVKTARARAIFVKERITARVSIVSEWVTQTQRNIREIVHRRREHRQQRSPGCKKHTKGRR